MKKLIILFCILILLPIVFAGTVTRSVDKTNPSSGETIIVTLTVDAATGDKAITIHEEAPFTIIGLTSNIYETALIDQIQVSDTTKTYSFIAGAIGTKYFSGVYRVNGATTDTQIGGVSSIIVGGTCVPSSVWTPDSSTICSGTPFQQTDNCGNTRTSTGTKSCTCTPSWSCTDWSVCSNNLQTRTCTDSNNCGITSGKPTESQSCDVPKTCSTNVDCEFYEKCESSECQFNTGLLIIAVIGLVLLRFILPK